ncbi:hypothetical protein GCM10023338_15530 [Wohlfahrtiimonas larvae]|uniref:Uncharacterized protein n=2 Tax=Wohlfahrtiimonas larvae TaxID=1157986 RepID=A0ABP9MSW7_9GAMM
MKKLYDELLENAQDNDSFILRHSLSKFVRLNFDLIEKLLPMISMKLLCEMLSNDTKVLINYSSFKTACNRTSKNKHTNNLVTLTDTATLSNNPIHAIPNGSNSQQSIQSNIEKDHDLSDIEKNLRANNMDSVTIKMVLDSKATWDDLCKACPELKSLNPLYRMNKDRKIRQYLKQLNLEEHMKLLKPYTDK